ncbi:MlaD family protein [Thermomonas sp. XSG]|jgi:phospholipid/cholesterol/gamma-HCH transport system substrate-binding protein|uniref:MlaD family protein n=1 Tax=Thermomonas sp. XSG TaxID=2771436 RepID=UPI0016802902|nr:MlaD family protein [Thermomonas sp. XSG]QNU15400.1 MCE family protein [Thermomonas sp. XSG]
METRANYVLIGTFTLVTTVLLLLFALWASNFSAARNWREYMVVFTEPVTGLTEGGSVQYNGLAVGTVESLNLDDNDARRVIARLKLKANTPVKTDTRAKLSQQGITGVPFIQLTGGSPNAPALQPSSDGHLPVIRTEPSALQNIADTANRLVARLDQVLSEDNIRRISQTLENLEQASGSIAGRREEIGELIVNARDATAAMKTALAHADGAIQGVDRNLVQRLPALLDKLDAVVTKLDATAGNANAMIAENRPALQSFTTDGLAQLGPTLVELRALMRDLRALSGRLEGNPARYILGRDAPKEFDPK